MNNSNNIDDNDVRIKIKCKLSKQFFPKDKIIENGDFGIISANVVDVLQGEPQINKWGAITLTGVMCEVKDDEIYIVVGKEIESEKFGLQYQIIFMATDVKLETREDQYRFLDKILSGNQCVEIFKTFDNPIEVLERGNINELCKVKGIGVPTAIRVLEKYESSKDFSEAYVELDKFGLSKTTIDKLVEYYKSPNIAVAKIKENPYMLIEEVDGFGWSKADEMALKSGLGEHSTQRVEAYIKYFLYQKANESGDTWIWTDDLLDAIDGTIGYDLPQDILSDVLKRLLERKLIWTNDDRSILALKKYFNLEANISKELKRIQSAKNNFNINNWQNKIKNLQLRQGWSFTDEQRLGIETILREQVVIITGLAGTGKTSTVSGMLEVFKEDYSFAQTALSGRASCNLTDVTGVDGYTIHRLLGFNPDGGFNHSKTNQLGTEIIILDEFSMVGADIFYKLIQSIKSGSKLIMLGDIGQLEAIGIGNLMRDMIDSGVIPCVNLTKIHRQAEQSAIITESRKVYNHEQITDKKFNGVEIRGQLQDLKLDIYDDKTKTHSKIVNYFKELLPHVENPFDIQVIVPMKDRGMASAYYLNNSIQKLVMDTSQSGMEIGKDSKFPFTLYVGDKVINLKNNYKTTDEEGNPIPIFNGDLGVVVAIDKTKQMLLIDFNTKGCVYIPRKHLIHIKLGYVITTHKLQGSSSPYVICGLDYSHYKLLNKEMVYTMLTRAKKFCILCAENKALKYAIGHSDVKKKQTFLKAMLLNEIKLDNYENNKIKRLTFELKTLILISRRKIKWRKIKKNT